MTTPVNTYVQIGIKEDVADWIANLEPNLTPFYSMIGKARATATKCEWQTDSDAKPGSNAQVEGDDFDDGDFTPTMMMSNLTQILSKVVKVSGTGDAVSLWGRGTESNYQVTKKGRELKADIEWAFLNNGAAVAGSATVGRKMAGISALVSVDDSGAIAADPLSGAITQVAAAAATPTADEIISLMGEIWKAGGRPQVLMTGSDMSDTISGMQEVDSTRMRMFENSTTVTLEVNTITDPLGQTVKVVYNRQMPAGTVLIFNPADFQELVLRAPHNVPVAKSGDYKKTAIVAEVSLRLRNPWAAGLLTPKA